MQYTHCRHIRQAKKAFGASFRNIPTAFGKEPHKVSLHFYFLPAKRPCAWVWEDLLSDNMSHPGERTILPLPHRLLVLIKVVIKKRSQSYSSNFWNSRKTSNCKASIVLTGFISQSDSLILAISQRDKASHGQQFTPSTKQQAPPTFHTAKKPVKATTKTFNISFGLGKISS